MEATLTLEDTANAVPGTSGQLDRAGWTILPGSVPDGLVARINEALPASLRQRDAIREAHGVAAGADGTLHHLLMDAPCYMEVLMHFEALDATLKAYFGGNYILNSYGGVINQAGTRSYVHRVHRDLRFSAEGRRFMLNALVMLDDFTVDNGATWLLSGSQTLPARPDDSLFAARAERATGRRGSILLFDSRIWHSAGDNRTPNPRRALTLTFTSPFFKPQLDYPRLAGYGRGASLTPWLRQVIGYNARIPSTLEEFYVPVEQRFYQRDQDQD